MLLIVSPAKKLDYEAPALTDKFTKPDYLNDSQKLINELKKYSALDLAELMNLSIKLAELNFDRYQSWKKQVDEKSGKQCIFAFQGDVYKGLDASSLSSRDLNFAQKHLRIISGLYGLLKPFDLMRPYRLEMGTNLKNERGKNLYEFWGEKITEGINEQLKLQSGKFVINLASNEYFKSIKKPKILGKVITPVFKEKKNNQYKVIGIHAKKARGLMSRFIIKNHLRKVDDIKSFDLEGYSFQTNLSDEEKWIFTR
tara:strand:- start:1393 stop:2157 length:765 start_codon:yes stop_codon:yes gene_type:complete